MLRARRRRGGGGGPGGGAWTAVAAGGGGGRWTEGGTLAAAAAGCVLGAFVALSGGGRRGWGKGGGENVVLAAQQLQQVQVQVQGQVLQQQDRQESGALPVSTAGAGQEGGLAWAGGPFTDNRYWGRQEGQTGFCEPLRSSEGGEGRPLKWVVPQSGEKWPPADVCAGREALCEVVRRIADERRAVMATVANVRVTEQVGILYQSLVICGVKNFLVIALDEGMVKYCKEHDIPFYFSPNDAQGNHGVSAMKFGIIKNFVEVGCSVLLTDTDVVYMLNPFPRLYYDSDLEGMSDGWDNVTTFGYMEAFQDSYLDPGVMTQHSVRTAALNSGLWFVAATVPSLRFLQQLEHLVTTEDIWDQTAYNLKVQQPSYGTKTHPGVTFRALSPLCFCNSKVLTRYILPSPHLGTAHVPVAVHVNYHSDKERKVNQLNRLYHEGEKHLAAATLKEGGLLDRKPLEPVEVVDDMRAASLIFSSPNVKWIQDELAAEAKMNKCQPRPNKLLQQDLGLLPTAAPQMMSTQRRANKGVKGGWPAQDACVANVGLARALVVAKQRERLCQSMAVSAFFGDVLAVVVEDDYTVSLLRRFLQSPGLKNLGNILVVSLASDLTQDSTEDLAKSLGWLAGQLPKVEASAGGAGWDYAVAVGALGRLGLLRAPGASRFDVGAALVGLGAGVLLTDPAVVFLQDPFKHLFRDHDLEVFSDGHRDGMVVGDDSVVDDAYMGWSRFGHGFRLSTMDPGILYAVPTTEAVRFLSNVGQRVRAGGEGHGDRHAPQGERLAFNMELFRLTHDAYVHSGAQIRAMKLSCWLSSRTVFKDLPTAALKSISGVAVAMRLSSTPREEVATKMDALIAASADGFNEEKLRAWKSDLVEKDACLGELNALPSGEDAPEVLRVLSSPAHRAWKWAGTSGFKFLAGGELVTPWGEGKWGVAQGGPAGSVEAEFVGQRHHLTFFDFYGEPFSMFRSVRCSDGDVVMGTRDSS